MSYIGAEPDGMGKAQRFTFTASGGETVVSADDDGIPIGYTAGQVSVYLNGVKLVVGTGKDCQATNGSTITGLAALAASDVVEVVALSIFSATTVEGTALISTGETGGTKFLREDGDGTSSWQTVTEDSSIDVIQTNIALLGFKVAVNGSLAKYNLQDQVIDEYTDASGIDATPSNNHVLAGGAYSGVGTVTVTPTVTHNAQATGTDGDYTWYKYTTVQAVTYTTNTAQNYDWLVVGGGGGGAGQMGAGGGAGGFRTGADYPLAATSYTITVGGGGDGGESSNVDGADEGDPSSIGSLIVSHGGGGGGGYGDNSTKCLGHDGGSGGGGASGLGTGFAGGSALALNPTQVSGEVTTFQGKDGGAGLDSTQYNAGGGGGASAVGETPSSANERGGDGGAGENNVMGMNDTDSDAFLTTLSVGHDSGGTRYFAGGGGGAAYPISNGYGAGGVGGGGSDSVGVANTGGGGGGKQGSPGHAGGSGIVIIRRLTQHEQPTPDDIILQSTDTTAEAVPTKADMVMLMEDAAGTATVNTDIKGYVSRDSGSTFIEGTLVDEGDWGTNKRILAFHDLSFTGASGTAMCYKITTHNQSTSKETKIHATSIGWR